MDEKKDVAGIGLSAEVRPTLETLTEKYFASLGGAFKACVALAIAKELQVVEPGKVDRTWHSGGAFTDLLEFVSWYYETESPAELVQALGHTGLLSIKRDVELGKPFEAIFG